MISFGTLVENYLTIFARVYFWALYSFVPFYGRIIFHCVDIPYFIYGNPNILSPLITGCSHICDLWITEPLPRSLALIIRTLYPLKIVSILFACFVFCLFYPWPLNIGLLEPRCREHQVHLPQRKLAIYSWEKRTSSIAKFSAYDYYKFLIKPKITRFAIHTVNILTNTLSVEYFLIFKAENDFCLVYYSFQPNPRATCVPHKFNVCWRTE